MTCQKPIMIRCPVADETSPAEMHLRDDQGYAVLRFVDSYGDLHVPLRSQEVAEVILWLSAWLENAQADRKQAEAPAKGPRLDSDKK